MRKLLLTTVAAAAVVGVAGLASAQTMQSPSTQAPAGGSAAKSDSTEHQAPGAMGGALKGNINGAGAAKSAQAPATSGKPDQRLGQEEQKEGQQKQVMPQHAQDEKSGAQQQRDAQEENSKSGANAPEQNASKTKGSGGGAVQLSQTQRTKIQAIIGRSQPARVMTNVNFNIAVGVTVPRDIHVEVLPADIVEIVPQFEGFDYIVVGDNILIIDPDTMEIVDIIAA